MIFGSVCSGIEAASVAWHPLGWRAAFLSEIEAFPRAVLAHRYPGVPLHGDFTTIKAGGYEPIDVLVGGTPCQSFSVAGLRGGMADERGNLALEYLRLADRLRPRWLLWENVPGVLSSNRGRDFGSFLGGLGQLGYGFAYRVLDAQHFGLAQRRKRVFVVGCLGDWRRAAAVLFEPASLRRHPAPRRQSGEGVARCLNAGAGAGGGCARYDGESDTLIAHAYRTSPNCGAWDTGDRIDALTTGSDPTSHVITHSLRADGLDASKDGTGRGTPLVAVDITNGRCGGSVAGTLEAAQDRGNRGQGVMTQQPFTLAIRGRDGAHDLEYRQDGTANALLTPNGGRGGIGVGAVAFSCKDHGGDAGATSPTLRAMSHRSSHTNGGGQAGVVHRSGVRRLTPVECERLQGFPDNWTNVPYRGKPAADGPRYRALGNSFAVPVVRAIGRRIAMVEAQA